MLECGPNRPKRQDPRYRPRPQTRGTKNFPKDDSVSVVYLDSYDELRRVNKGLAEVLSGGMSQRHQRFVDTCKELGLPLNEGKRLVGAVYGTLQGGGFDGSLWNF